MTTKKLLRNIALLLLPVVLYYGIFLAFEPNNFFGLRPTTPSGAVFGVVKEYKRDPASTVILGDSRLAHIDMDLVHQRYGGDIANLAFMGATLKEETDMLDWVLAHYPGTKTVVFGLSFYTLNKNYNADRWESIEQSMTNPFLYLTSFSYNLEALQNASLWAESGWKRLTGQSYTPFVMGGGEHETMNPADYEWVDYTTPATGETVLLRKTVAEHMDNMAGYLASWELDEEGLDRLLETIEACDEKGIEFVVVLPPLHEALREYALEPYGIQAQMEEVIAALNASPAKVYDYEFTMPPGYAEDMFYDTLHLDYERGLPVWTGEFFGALA